MGNWFEKHPFQTKMLELAIGTGFSVAGAALSAFITGKIHEKASEKKPVLKEDELIVTNRDLTNIVTEVTALTSDYGDDWYNDKEAQKKFTEFLGENTSLGLIF